MVIFVAIGTIVCAQQHIAKQKALRIRAAKCFLMLGNGICFLAVGMLCGNEVKVAQKMQEKQMRK